MKNNKLEILLMLLLPVLCAGVGFLVKKVSDLEEAVLYMEHEVEKLNR